MTRILILEVIVYLVYSTVVKFVGELIKRRLESVESVDRKISKALAAGLPLFYREPSFVQVLRIIKPHSLQNTTRRIERRHSDQEKANITIDLSAWAVSGRRQKLGCHNILKQTQ